MRLLPRCVPTFVTAFALGLSLMFGCAYSTPNMEIGQEIIGGVEEALQQEDVFGYARNHTPFIVAFGVFRATEQPSDAIFKYALKPDETVFFYLEPGNYIIAGMLVDMGGQIVREFTNPFEIKGDGTEFSFDFRIMPRTREMNLGA